MAISLLRLMPSFSRVVSPPTNRRVCHPLHRGFSSMRLWAQVSWSPAQFPSRIKNPAWLRPPWVFRLGRLSLFLCGRLGGFLVSQTLEHFFSLSGHGLIRPKKLGHFTAGSGARGFIRSPRFLHDVKKKALQILAGIIHANRLPIHVAPIPPTPPSGPYR